jgi:hypothetical protein
MVKDAAPVLNFTPTGSGHLLCEHGAVSCRSACPLRPTKTLSQQ